MGDETGFASLDTDTAVPLIRRDLKVVHTLAGEVLSKLGAEVSDLASRTTLAESSFYAHV